MRASVIQSLLATAAQVTLPYSTHTFRWFITLACSVRMAVRVVQYPHKMVDH